MAPNFDDPVLAPAATLNAVPLLPVIKAYMAQIGRKGGSVRSELKTLACRLNATRPRKKR